MALKLVPQLFEDQARLAPEAAAVECGSASLTYRELNERANRLARVFRRAGIGPERLVAICLERSPEMIAALLGVLKAGGAYLPIDPAYPSERIAFFLADSEASLLVSQASLVGRLPDRRPATLVLEEAEVEIRRESPDDPSWRIDPETLAYVIYTSGSTGLSKGVLVPHSALANLTAASGEAYGITGRDRDLQFASISFDASAEQIYCALTRGATVVLRTDTMLGSIRQFLHECDVARLTVLTPPTAFWHEVAAGVIEEDLRLPASVRLVIVGGERILPRLAAEWQRRFGRQARLVNAYGPTETTVTATLYDIPEDPDPNAEIPIGRPIANLTAYVLDGERRPVPPGATGELYIGGAGVARGYLKRPELTAERFLPDPFASTPSARLYRTGDLARWRADGNLEFLGRLDNQTKIRSFRVEPGEIEALLARHEAVREAIVTVAEDGAGQRRLLAYVVPSQAAEAGSGSPSADSRPGALVQELRRFLESRLPEYMVPSAFVLMSSWPLTPQGKIDRERLPAPSSERSASDAPFVAPATDAEEILCRISAELLGLEAIGLDDDFFALGGHSLVAVRLLSRIRSRFGVELSFSEFFRSPTVRQTAARISGAERKEGRRPISIARVDRTRDLPLSPSQESVWFLQQLDPESRAYQFQTILRFRGELDASALQRSLAEIVRRHEIFRTTFPERAGHPVQHVHEVASLPLTVVDLTRVDEKHRGAQLRRRIEVELRRRFDLDSLPLVRWTLFRLAAREHVFLHVEHHVVHDGWSLNVFLRELGTLYRSFHEGESSPLSEPEIQFADFACFQRSWAGSDEAVAQRRYWLEKLADPPPPLEIPADRPRPAAQTFRGAAPLVDLPVDLAEAVRQLSRRRGSTLFMTMLAAFGTMLSRYTRRVDFCIGSGVANRRWRETEGVLGMIVNTVALRMDLAGNPTFAEVLRRVRTMTLEAYENQDIPFASVVGALQPERSLSHAPLCQVLFSFHDSPFAELDFGDVDVQMNEAVSNGSAKFDLNIVVIPRSEQRLGQSGKTKTNGISLIWEYNSDLFDESTIRRMIGHFETILRAVVADDERPVSSLPLLTAEEERQLRVEFNPAPRDYPRGATVHQLFEARAGATPNAPALLFDGQSWSYGELNGRANRLAHRLRRLGLGREGLVGVTLERSPDLIVALLGVLKAGGAYVPVDPEYPRERIGFLLRDSRVSAVLTRRELLDRMPTDSIARPVCLDSDWATIASESDRDPEPWSTAESLAYVLYTSGSTGRPKGVCVEHRAVVRLAFAPTYVRVTPDDTLLQFASSSFDASTFEIWGALLNGARLAVAPAGQLSLDELGSVIQENDVSVLWLAAGLFHQMVDEALESLRGVRELLAGGDVLSAAHVRRFLRELPDCRLVNGYGPTESTTFACTYPMRGLDDVREPVPIGRPIANTRVSLLDSARQLVPIGIPGELFIGGDGLARGYLGHEALTAERFVVDPLDPEQRERLYRTGDLARYLADGNIEFLGREDCQVKVRGFRVELGEVEAALKRHARVREAVVIARRESSAGNRLWAYFVPAPDDPPPPAELRRHLQQTLPDYMIPSRIVRLAAMPLTAHGKVNRAALPADGRPDRSETESFVAPRTRAEAAIARIWSEVLGLERIGVHDNFFELGGHSLLATRIIARIRNRFRVDLPMRRLFESPTVAGLARALEAGSEAGKTKIPPILPHTRPAKTAR